MLPALRAACVALVAGGGTALLHYSSPAVVDEEESEKPADYTTEEAIRLLWYGYDVGHEVQGALARAPRVRYSVRTFNVSKYTVDPHAGEPKLLILGPKDSGVSLLMETLELNYLSQLKKACGWEDIWIDKDRPWTGHIYCRAFSHGLLTSDAQVSEGANSLYTVLGRQNTDPQDTVVLFVVKSPLATMQSWSTSIRERTPCIQRPAREWDTPCTGQDIAWKEAGQRDRKHTEKVKNTMELYNRYMRMYHRVQKDRKFRKAMFVTYEDLIAAPADVVLKIAHAMNWPVLGDIEMPEGLSANGFPAPGRPLMVEHMVNRSWLSWTPKETRDVWCRGLSSRAFDDLKENSLHLPEFPYAEYGFDCKYVASLR